MAWPTAAGCHVNTEASNKVKKGADIARNTVFYIKNSKSKKQSVSVKGTLP